MKFLMLFGWTAIDSVASLIDAVFCSSLPTGVTEPSVFECLLDPVLACSSFFLLAFSTFTRVVDCAKGLWISWSTIQKKVLIIVIMSKILVNYSFQTIQTA